jgi:hypothetical protein
VSRMAYSWRALRLLATTLVPGGAMGDDTLPAAGLGESREAPPPAAARRGRAPV